MRRLTSYPDPEFMRRFAGHEPAVRNGSQFAVGDGLIFHILHWKWVSDKHIEVLGGYYEASLSASVSTYTVVRKDGRWVVEGDDGSDFVKRLPN